MITDKSSTSFDNRVATIELIYNAPINLDASNLVQIILPAIFLDDPKIESLVTDTYNLKNPLIYELIKGTPDQYFGLVYNLYLNHLKSMGS